MSLVICCLNGLQTGLRSLAAILRALLTKKLPSKLLQTLIYHWTMLKMFNSEIMRKALVLDRRQRLRNCSYSFLHAYHPPWGHIVGISVFVREKQWKQWNQVWWQPSRPYQWLLSFTRGDDKTGTYPPNTFPIITSLVFCSVICRTDSHHQMDRLSIFSTIKKTVSGQYSVYVGHPSTKKHKPLTIANLWKHFPEL